MTKTITTCFFFASSSSDKEYQTLQYDDDTTSCDCPGWTRRVDALGNRSCKHTRSVDANQGLLFAKRFVDYSEPRQAPATTSTKTNRKQTSAPSVLDQGARQFSFET